MIEEISVLLECLYEEVWGVLSLIKIEEGRSQICKFEVVESRN